MAMRGSEGSQRSDAAESSSDGRVLAGRGRQAGRSWVSGDVSVLGVLSDRDVPAEPLGQRPVTLGGGVLVAQGDGYVGVAATVEQLGEGGALLGVRAQAGVPQV